MGIILMNDTSRRVIADINELGNKKNKLDRARANLSEYLAHPNHHTNSFQSLAEIKRQLVWDIDDAEVALSRLTVDLTAKYNDPAFRKLLLHLKMLDPNAYYWDKLKQFI